ncbi:MAG: hypothetical protein HOV71_16515 [Hamadaea sp.]|uniref:hypothetical protein n=1 Tax=Hamadaea sp. NPDC050747 TaxID=3155789 RepID=UPI0017A991DB|nr:hypothetical protein [Hamadaea sp.]NUR49732.1 hypothetical protein [Hamadaea sp.]NUT03882.1 hypothetical protein [Hamadaea sp.]
MNFVQIVEYETERADEIAELMGKRRDEAMASGERPPFTQLLVTRDRDNPNRYLTIIEFSSYDEAMANSDRPETDAMAKELAQLCTRGPVYHNLDVLDRA